MGNAIFTIQIRQCEKSQRDFCMKNNELRCCPLVRDTDVPAGAFLFVDEARWIAEPELLSDL
jgi:hypothetical protein